MQPRPHVCLHLPRHPCCPGIPARGHPGATALSPLPVLARGARCSGGARQRCLEQGEQFPQLPSPWCAQQMFVSTASPSFSQAGTVSFPPLGWHLLLCLPACCQPPSCQALLAGRALGLQSHCFSEPLSVSFNPLASGPQVQCSVFCSPHTLLSRVRSTHTLSSEEFDKLAFSVFRISPVLILERSQTNTLYYRNKSS